MVRLVSILLFCALVLFFGCKKKEEEPKIPIIELIEITPLSMVQYEESIYITIGYSDLDGDIGYENPDQYALQIKDNRLADPDWYHVPPLSPIGRSQRSGFARVGFIDFSSYYLLGIGFYTHTFRQLYPRRKKPA